MTTHTIRLEKATALLMDERYQESQDLLEQLFAETRATKTGQLLSIAYFNNAKYFKALEILDLVMRCEYGNPFYYQTKFEFFTELKKQNHMSEDIYQFLVLKLLNELHEKSLHYAHEPDHKYVLALLFETMNEKSQKLSAVRDLLKRNGVPEEAIKALDDEEVEYCLKVEKAKRTTYVDYPAHVAFETFAQCNAACTFCVYPDMERKGKVMPMELIEKIINDLAEIPQHHQFQLSPFAVNEPFLDKRLFKILDLITERLPHASITLTSNASPINEKNLKQLSKYNISYLWLSVVDHRREVYEEKMKLDYNRLIDRLNLIHKAKDEGWLKNKIFLSRLCDNSQDDNDYLNFFKARYPLFEAVLWPYANWLGRTENNITTKIKALPCLHWYDFRIDANGIVQHCCMDGHSEYPWGDVNKDSILNIYNSERYRHLRTSQQTRLDVEPCNRCNLR